MHPESLRIARHWLVTGLEKARDFVVLQDDIDWLQSLTPPMLETIAFRIHSFRPQAPSFFHVPKDDGSFRRVPILSVQDRLMLTALIADNFDVILKGATCNTQACVDYQYPLPQNRQDTNWVNEWKDTYAAFRQRSMDLENEGYFVLNTDIKDFAPSCQHGYLIDILRHMGWKPQSLATLDRAFAQWRAQGLCGIPQGLVVTEILTKCYLSDLDWVMSKHKDVVFFRYSDDIRLASRDAHALEDARMDMETMLGDAGLMLKPEKTFISSDRAPRTAWRIETVFDPLLEKAGLPTGLQKGQVLPLAILEEVYEAHLSPRRADPAIPPQTLFNFTMNRLSQIGSRVAHADMGQLVQEHPGKILDLLRHALQTGYRGFRALHDQIADANLRTYFKYALLLRSSELVEKGGRAPDEVAALAGDWASGFDKALPPYIKAKAAEVHKVISRRADVDINLDHPQP